MNEISQINYNRLKREFESYEKIIKNLVRAIPSQDLIKELKRRKLLSIDWNKGNHNFKEVEKTFDISDETYQRIINGEKSK